MNIDNMTQGLRKARLALGGDDVPDTIHDPPEWTLQSVCTSVDPELWFPEFGGSARKAKAICSRCPVKAECLAYALDNNEHFGVWGGLSERERHRLKRRAA